MPFLTRGKARARQNKPSPPQVVTPPAPIEETQSITPETSETDMEQTNVLKQEVTYRVPKEERLIDLPLEEEILEDEEETNGVDEQTYNIMPVGNPVSIGAVLKKKKRR